MAVDWSQFQPVAMPSQGTDWSQFQPVPDETQSGPPEASFRGIRADSATTAAPPPPSPLSQFWGDVKAVPGQMATGIQAITQGGDYAQDPNDTRRVLGVGEGMLRDTADIMTGFANQAYQWSPMGVAERTAQQIASNLGGPTLPTVANVFEAGTEAAHAKVGIDENTMRFQSPRQEAVARFVPELLSNAIPIGGAAHDAQSLLASGERALEAEMRAGVHGPDAQGIAVADQLIKGAVPDVRSVPAERGPVLPDAALDASAEPVPREALPVQAPEPVQAEAQAPVTGEPVPAGAPEPNPVTEAFAQKLSDHPTAASEYAAIPDTEGGRVLNTDTARELSPDYLTDRTKSADVHEPASAFIKRLYADKLSQPTPEGMDPTVLFTAGGTGAGKSTGLKLLGDNKAEIVYDTNMNKFDSAKTKIDQALDAGRDVHILYTYRDPVEALQNGALPRAMRQEGNFGSGRTVPMAEHVDTHLGSYDTMQRIAQEYKDDPRVHITAIDNSLGRGNAKVSSLDAIPNPHRGDLHAELAQALDEARARGEISEPVYQGFKSASSRGAEQAGGRGVREEPQPTRAGGNANALGETDAGEVRGPEGEVSIARREPERSQDLSGQGVQRNPETWQPIPQRLRGQGEAPTRPVQEPLGPTGIKKAALASERPEFNWEATTAHLRRSDPVAYERARAEFEKNPNHGVDLANSLAEKPRPISKEEVLALNMDRARIRTERNAAYAEGEKAINRGDNAAAAAARARVDRLDEEYARNDIAAAHSGHETAEGLRSRQLMTNDDYTMAGAVRRATVKKGEKLTPEERGKIERLANEHAQAEEAAAAEKAPRVKAAQTKFDSLAEKLKKAPRRVLCETA